MARKTRMWFTFFYVIGPFVQMCCFLWWALIETHCTFIEQTLHNCLPLLLNNIFAMIFPFPSAMSKEFGLYRKYSELNHHKNSFVSLKIWEKSQSMLLRNKYTVYYHLIFKNRIVMLISTPLLMKLTKITLIQCIVTFIYLLIYIFIQFY